jgi:hypothetical protein
MDSISAEQGPRADVVELTVEFGRALAFIAVILYGWRFSSSLIQHFPAYVQAEANAINFLIGETVPGAPIPGAPEEVGGIFAQAAFLDYCARHLASAHYHNLEHNRPLHRYLGLPFTLDRGDH